MVLVVCSAAMYAVSLTGVFNSLFQVGVFIGA